MGFTLFILAAAIAVFGILFVYKRSVDVLKTDVSAQGQVQQRFFVSASVIEAIPIVLIILAFVNQDTAVTVDDLLLPVAFIIGLIIFAIVYIFLQAFIDVDEQSKGAVRQLSAIALMLVLAIPIVALIMMIISGDIS